MPQPSLEASVGETVKVLFGTSESPAYVLYELFNERGELLKRERVTMQNENRYFPIHFVESYGQGVTASFVFVKDGQLNMSRYRNGN
jgi:hypothetical protein